MNDSEPVKASGPSADVRVTRDAGISYLQIPAVDGRESAEFYESVFGWTVSGRDTERPSFDDGTGHVIGTWLTNLAVSAKPGLVPYVYVNDIDDTVEKIGRHGGELTEGPRPEGTLRVATFRDCAGNVMGLWQETAR
jgi:predicted enzyme related to lactoylglutathione lyase